MHPSGSCKCRSCGEFFQPDARNRGRQRHCRKVPCQKARKAASQRAWLRKDGNQDYFQGEANVARVQVWRKANPGYWKRRQGAQPHALQDALKAQPPVVVGLVAHLTAARNGVRRATGSRRVLLVARVRSDKRNPTELPVRDGCIHCTRELRID